MKKTLLLFCFIVFSNIAIAQDKKIVGTWKGINREGTNIEFVFDSEGYITMSSRGEVIGGKEFEIQGVKASTKYETDQTTNPFKLIYKLINLSGNIEVGSMGGVYKYINHNEILLRFNPNPGQTYNDFSDTEDDDTFVLKRK